MSSSKPTPNSHQPTAKKRRFLTADKKFQIYLEAQNPAVPVGEILRREGLFSTDLARIRQQVKEGALLRLSVKPGRAKDHSNVSAEAHEALKNELQQKERALADQAVELAILRKKNEWGFVGPLSATWIHVETKLEILSLFEASQLSGVSVRRSCLILSIEHRRVVRWQRQLRQGLPLHNRTPGPNQPPHRLLPEEAAQIVSVATSEEYADLSHRILSVMAGDLGLFQAAFSTVYRVLVAHDLMQARCQGAPTTVTPRLRFAKSSQAQTSVGVGTSVI